MDLDNEIRRFKMDLLRKLPFYGDIIMRLPIRANPNCPTARTNGRQIEYNPQFLAAKAPEHRNFILMHELFHVLLLHTNRRNERNPQIWNAAADIVVNGMLINLIQHMKRNGIPFGLPNDGIVNRFLENESVENIYKRLLDLNKKSTVPMGKNVIMIGSGPGSSRVAPDDLILSDHVEESMPGLPQDNTGRTISGGKDDPAETGLSEQALLEIIRNAASANRSTMGSYFVPNQLLRFTESKHLDWKALLRDFLVDTQNDDSSYATPERKYIHMDLILPGYGTSAEKLEEVWAFVDSSGSIGTNEMQQFLTQIYRIAKEFKCVFNICYWDTRVTDIYRSIKKENDILACIPLHSGGTDINCVYRWLRQNRIRPDVMLILTDGYFGALSSDVFIPSLAEKTILVLSSTIAENDSIRKIGKYTRL